ncbi:transcription factor bHLH112-like protein isoform X1 [Cucumis melo var. makuwa]|uniref:Transcription factor bHLH112-like protein isoform X1 n=1 Tax=Cucumis melo var. makuwa TaxID=1194695 RepID=A0A5D3DS02_CUCMM|nr:transcription factor bHLH112-like protein isoform X1 [Cucumis melo var. makuwa]
MADEFPARSLFSAAVTNTSPCSVGNSTFLIDSTITSTSNWNQSFRGWDDGQRVDTTVVVDSMTVTKLNYDDQEITSGSEGQQNPTSFFKTTDDDHDSLFLMEQPYNIQTATNFYHNVVTTTTSQGLPMAFPFEAISIGPMFQTHLLHPPPLNFSNGITPKCPTKLMGCDEVVEDWSRVERENESKEIAIIKRPRSDNSSSPLPTFKVRKEKLGDKITALQQLVSPFGKTDTASVLHEAIEYIKFLHNQIRVLSTPYMEIGDHNQEPKIIIEEELKNTNENMKEDLRSRGLCLVTIPSTVALANGNILNFWSPTFGDCNLSLKDRLCVGPATNVNNFSLG